MAQSQVVKFEFAHVVETVVTAIVRRFAQFASNKTLSDIDLRGLEIPQPRNVAVVDKFGRIGHSSDGRKPTRSRHTEFPAR